MKGEHYERGYEHHEIGARDTVIVYRGAQNRAGFDARAVELKAESMRMKINADEHFATCGGVIEERNGETYLRIRK